MLSEVYYVTFFASLPISSLDSLGRSFDEEDDEWCDEEFLLLDEEETGEESEDAEQYLHDDVTGIEGATPTPKRPRVAKDALLALGITLYF